MIVHFIDKPSGGNRGQAPGLIKYMFGATKENSKEVKASNVTSDEHRHTGEKEKVHFVTCSKNMCITDPMYIEKDGAIIKIDGATADLTEIFEDFAISEARNTTSDYPLEHIVLSLQEGEELSMEDAANMVDEYMQKMGYENCTWICTKHEDTDNFHYHVALCNISNEPPHNSVQPSNKYQLSAQVRTELEAKYGLAHDKTPFVDLDCDFNKELSKNKLKNTIRSAIREVFENNRQMTLPQFMREMNQRGVGVFASLKNNEQDLQGLSFSVQGKKIQASHLGKGYSTKSIMENVNYEMVRDLYDVNKLNAEEKDRSDAYELAFKEIEKKIAEVDDILSDDRKTLYLVTEATQEQIDELMEGNKPNYQLAEKGSSKSLAAIQVKIDSNDADIAMIPYRSGQKASQYFLEIDKKKAQKEETRLKKAEAKRQAELNKLIRQLVSAFHNKTTEASLKEEQQYQDTMKSLDGLQKYGIDSKSSVSLISGRQLAKLKNEVWNKKDGPLRLVKAFYGENREYIMRLQDGTFKVAKPALNQIARTIDNDPSYTM